MIIALQKKSAPEQTEPKRYQLFQGGHSWYVPMLST